MTQITEEVKEIFEDKDLKINKVLRELATCFGADASINEVAKALDDFNIPTKKINGITYKAGYKGSTIIKAGTHFADLLDVQTTNNSIKLLFGINEKYIFQTITNPAPSVVVLFTKNIGEVYSVDVVHEVIPQTGSTHAVVKDSTVQAV